MQKRIKLPSKRNLARLPTKALRLMQKNPQVAIMNFATHSQSRRIWQMLPQLKRRQANQTRFCLKVYRPSNQPIGTKEQLILLALFRTSKESTSEISLFPAISPKF